MFFYATLYMQEILGYSPLEAGAAYLVALRIGNTRNPAPLVMVAAEAAPEPYHAK
jgi:hypothetical protein